MRDSFHRSAAGFSVRKASFSAKGQDENGGWNVYVVEEDSA
jgi:hypothetical protein